VPVWHEKTRDLRASGKLAVLGIVEEQHADRARLFVQWKGIDWPVLGDPVGLTGVGVVPILLLVDEQGVIRHVGSPAQDPGPLLAAFLADTSEPEREKAQPAMPRRPDLALLERRAREGGAPAWRELGDALVLWERDPGCAVTAYETAARLAAPDAALEFRLGVAYRMRHDSLAGPPGDFARAVAAWEDALGASPNNYIWRRRIQQYGPVSAKPYPFYDWVEQARREIAARGETPIALAVEPRGAELAAPMRGARLGATEEPEPDPEGRIARDPGQLVLAEATAVPGAVAPGGSTRIHLDLRPKGASDAHWNNEAGGVVLWAALPAGWAADPRRAELGNPAPRVGTVSDEPRHLEFEAHCPEKVSAGEVEIRAYVLYYVCEGRQGRCLYRRQDVTVPLRVTGALDVTSR